MELLARPAVVAVPAPIWHFNVQAVRVKSCWAGLTAQQTSACRDTEKGKELGKQQDQSGSFASQTG